MPVSMHSAAKPLSRLMGLSDTTKSRRSIISLTPLIDVVFILLVFFMLTSSFPDWRSITVSTAKPAAAVASDDRSIPLILSINVTQIRLNGELLAMDAIIARLRQRLAIEPETMIKVQPIGDTPLQSVIHVLDQLVVADISNFSMTRDSAWQVPENVTSQAAAGK